MFSDGDLSLLSCGYSRTGLFWWLIFKGMKMMVWISVIAGVALGICRVIFLILKTNPKFEMWGKSWKLLIPSGFLLLIALFVESSNSGRYVCIFSGALCLVVGIFDLVVVSNPSLLQDEEADGEQQENVEASKGAGHGLAWLGIVFGLIGYGFFGMYQDSNHNYISYSEDKYQYPGVGGGQKVKSFSYVGNRNGKWQVADIDAANVALDLGMPFFLIYECDGSCKIIKEMLCDTNQCAVTSQFAMDNPEQGKRPAALALEDASNGKLRNIFVYKRQGNEYSAWYDEQNGAKLTKK
jgi:hypothetical protein